MPAKMRVELAYYTAKLPTGLKDSDVKEKMFEMFDRIVLRRDAPKPAAFLSTAPDATTGIVFNIDGKSAYATYASEHGLHAFLEEKAVHNILVDTSETSFKDYSPPSSLERRGSINPASHGERRRVYHRTEGYIEDRVLDDRREWQSNSDVSAILKDFIDLMHEHTAEKLIVE